MAAGLSHDHDAKEERRAWAQRAGVGRVTRGKASRTAATPANRAPAVSLSVGQPASELGKGRVSASYTTSRPIRSSLGDHGGDDRSRSAHRRWGREGSTVQDRATAMETEVAFGAPVALPSGKNETATDMVSRAFKRYAKDRDMDRHRDHRTDKQRPRQRPSSAPFALAPQAGGDNRQHHRMPRASSDNEDGLESDRRSTVSSDYFYPPAFHHAQRQPRGREETRPLGVRPSKTYRDGRAGNGREGQATGINSGDEGGGRTRGRSSTPLPPDQWGQSGQRKGTAENKGNRGYGGGGEDEAWEEEGDEIAISVSERERALRKAFEMYDLNGDGVITYLEVGDGDPVT